jgi:hypothetical protein
VPQQRPYRLKPPITLLPPPPQTPEHSALLPPQSALEATASLLDIISSIYGPEEERPRPQRRASSAACWQQQAAADKQVSLRIASSLPKQTPEAGVAAAEAEESFGAAVELAVWEEPPQDSVGGTDGAPAAAPGAKDDGACSNAELAPTAPEPAAADATALEQALQAAGAEDYSAASRPASGGAASGSVAEPVAGPDVGGAPTCGASLEALAARVAARERLQAELSGYVQGLPSRLSEDGAPLLDAAPSDLLAAVRRLLVERRGEFRALDGWDGPRK